jgi:hypothetical protein
LQAILQALHEIEELALSIDAERPSSEEREEPFMLGVARADGYAARLDSTRQLNCATLWREKQSAQHHSSLRRGLGGTRSRLLCCAPSCVRA